jgi:hypothetical protein
MATLLDLLNFFLNHVAALKMNIFEKCMVEQYFPGTITIMF